MFVNTYHSSPWFSSYWSHRWENGPAARVPKFVDKFTAWRPKQQRPRDGTEAKF